jgi:DNA-binding PadR family transcriptional regulator
MSLRFVLLALLSKEPNSGYGVGRLLQKELSHLRDARLQQIYGELSKLQADGLVTAKSIDLPNRPAKKVYSLTPPGQEALDEWLAQRPAPIACKDDLLVKLYCLERIPTDVIIRRLEERREQAESEVRELRRRLAQTPRTHPGQLGHVLVLEAALSRAEGQVSWCAKALSCVREGDQAAAPSVERERIAGLRAAGA